MDIKLKLDQKKQSEAAPKPANPLAALAANKPVNPLAGLMGGNKPANPLAGLQKNKDSI